MSSELVGPEASEFLIQVLVFLRDRSLDRANICVKFLVCHFSDLGTHLSEESVKSLADVEAVLGR